MNEKPEKPVTKEAPRQPGMRRPVIFGIACLFLAAGVLTIVTAAAVMKRRGGDIEDDSWRNKKWIDEFVLTERTGKKFRSQDMDGKVWVVSFFFASCPTECTQQNQTIAELHHEFGPKGVTFVSITVDPENDTPAKLREYANRFGADPKHWLFLTGQLNDIMRIGSERFKMFVEQGGHSSKLAVVDKWGDVRGQFEWKDAAGLRDFRQTVKTALAETSPPPKVEPKEIEYDHGDWKNQDPNEGFTLTERSGEKFHSKDLAGRVWVASFFHTSSSTASSQNTHIERLHKEFGPRGVTFVSFTCDPQRDDPAQLAEYAKMYKTDPASWLFLTGDSGHIRLIGMEVFNAFATKDNHTTKLFVVNQNGEVVDSFDCEKPDELASLKATLEDLLGQDAEQESDEKASDVPGGV